MERNDLRLASFVEGKLVKKYPQAGCDLGGMGAFSGREHRSCGVRLDGDDSTSPALPHADAGLY